MTIEVTGLADYHAELSAKAYGYARPGLVKEPWGATTMTINLAGFQTPPTGTVCCISPASGHPLAELG